MPYFLINGDPVFLHTKLYARVQNEAFQHLDQWSRAMSVSAFAGTKDSKKADRLMYKYLKEQCAKNPSAFHANFVNFDLCDSDAIENVWDLLYDYCVYYRCGYLSDVRDDFAKMIADYAGDSYTFPMGKVFNLNLYRPKKRFLGGFFMRRGHEKTIRIDARTVQRIAGNLKSAIVYTPTCEILLAKTFNIVPMAVE